MNLSKSVPQILRQIAELSKARKRNRTVFETLDFSRNISASVVQPLEFVSESGRGKAVNSEQQRSQQGHAAVDKDEVKKFSAMAANWWDPAGPMAPLHSMNPIRVKFCRQVLSERFGLDIFAHEPLRGLKVADIGAGGGLLSEALARIGASVEGIDASKDAVGVARLHAQADDSICSRLRYQEGTAEQLVQQGAVFDAVVASEVIEHVPNPESFCQALAALVRPRGTIIVSTLNRTPRSYALAVLAAEKILGILPSGTHEWNKFISPDELVMLLKGGGLELDAVQGMTLDLLSRAWSLSDDLGVNYIAAFSKS